MHFLLQYAWRSRPYLQLYNDLGFSGLEYLDSSPSFLCVYLDIFYVRGAVLVRLPTR